MGFACERFHQYIFGQTVEVETDHKPLVAIFSKALNDCPSRIQRIRLRLQKYDLKLTYVPRKYMYTTDTLSRATQLHTHVDQKRGRHSCEHLRRCHRNSKCAGEYRRDTESAKTRFRIGDRRTCTRRDGFIVCDRQEETKNNMKML